MATDVLLVHELPIDMHTDDGSEERRLAHILPPLVCSSDPLPPYRPPPPPSSAESRIAFRGWLGAPRHWDLWVAKLRPIHEGLWREVGILDAVLASTYRFKRHASAVLHLTSFWSLQTNTFAFPWGEATLTLQDVAVLGGFPADGSPVPAPLPPEWRPDEAALNGVRLGFNRSTCKKAHHAAWMKHFLTDTGDADAGMEHAAFLALWLARFALPGHPEATMRQSLFPLAVRLARGERVALGPAVLASLYRDLREMKAYLVSAGATGGNAELLPSLSVYAPLYILQLWMWERFPTLWDGKAKPIKDVEPRAARWHDVSKKMNPAVIREVLNSGKNFLWQPYTSSMLARKQHSGWVRANDVAENKELRSLAHYLRACELVGTDCIEQYLPHRVAMQFGLDQDVPGDVRRANEDWKVAWETYDLEEQNVAFFIPRSKPGVTARYAQWWRQPLPPNDLDVCAANIAIGGKVSKRKVKKTPAAMEAEAEKERKMKKARTSPNSDKKRKLEDLYDAKLSDWFAAAKNGSSGSAGSSCKRGSSPKSDMGSDKALLDSAESSEDDTVLLVPRTYAITPAVNLKKDKEINLAIGDIGNFKARSLVGMKDKGMNSKGYVTGDVDHPMNQAYLKEKKSGVLTEISASTVDGKGERSDMDLQNTNKLVSMETPDVDCSEDARMEVVTIDKLPDISSEPETGATVIQEEKRFDLPEYKCLGVRDRPEGGITVMLELDRETSLAADEFCGVSNRPEEVTAPVVEEKGEEADVVVAHEGGTDIEGVGRAARGTSCSFEAVMGSKQEVDAGVMKYPRDAVALPEEILSVQQANCVDECIEIPCIMENSNVDAGVLGGNDGETTCGFISEGQRELLCVEDTGVGQRSEMIERDSNQNSQEAPRVDITEFGEDIILMDKDNEVAHENFFQTVAEAVTENNMAAVLLVVPEADMGKALKIAKKDTEDKPTELVEVAGPEQYQINTLAMADTAKKHKDVAEADHIGMAGRNLHAQFDTEEPGEAAEVRDTEMDEGKKLTGSDAHGNLGDLPHVGNSGVEKTWELIEDGSGENLLSEVSYVAHAEMELLNVLMKEDTDKKFEEVSKIRNTRTDGTHGPTNEHTDGKLAEISAEAHAEMQEVKGLMQNDTCKEFGVVSEVGNTGSDGHAQMGKDTDVKLKEVPEVNAQVEQANGFEGDNDRRDSILQVDPPARDEARWLVEEDTEDNTKIPQVKHEKTRDDALIEKDIEDKLNADGKDLLPAMEIWDSTEVFQVEKEEGEQSKVLNKKGTGENTKDVLGVKQVVGQDKALTARNMHDNIEDIILAEQVDGQTEMLTRVVVEENPEENTQAQGKEFDEDTMRPSMNSINSEMQCSLASQQSKGEETEISVEGMMEKQCLQDGKLIHEREPSSDGGSVKVEGVDNHKTLNTREEVAMKQTHDRGIMCENKESQTLEDSHILFGRLESDLVTMEVDDTFTGGFQNQEISDSDKQQKMQERHDLEHIVESNKIITSRDANMLGCGEFQSDSPGMKDNEAEFTKGIQNQETLGTKKVSPKGIQNQETLGTKKEHILGKRLVCEITDGNGRTLEVINTLGGGLADTIVNSGDISNTNSVGGVQNQEVCSADEVREDKQHHGVEDANENRILAKTNTIDSDFTVDGAESSEGTQNLKEEPDVQEKQDEGGVDENKTRILVNIDDPGRSGVRPDGTRKVTHEALSTMHAVYIAGDENAPNSQQEGVQKMRDEGLVDDDMKRILVGIDAPECDGVTPDGSMKVDHDTLCTVQAVNMAGGTICSKNQQKCVPLGDRNKLDVQGSESNQTARKEELKGPLQPEVVCQVEVKEEILENRTELSIGRENDEASEHDQISTKDANIAPSRINHLGKSNDEWAEEPIKIYGKYASYPGNTGCQTSKFGRSSIEEVRRIHSARSVYLKDIKEAQGRIRAEPSSRAQINNAGYYSGHGVQEPVSVSKDIKVPLHESARIYGRERAPELVACPAEETSRWRQEQYALNILEDVQNARGAEKTRMEMEIRILKSQIASMQRQVMNLDHVSVTSRSKRH